LDATADILPNPTLFVGMYARKEAVLSLQIEGTQASLVDLLAHEAATPHGKLPPEVAEIINYIEAMNYGLQRVNELPLSNRLLREIHRELLKGVRGEQMTPGEFRTRQNWIGPAGCGLSDAVFVPPPPHEMERAIGQLETFIHSNTPMPALVKIGLIHSQFETIHPFLDGNGRIGRLLITFFLCQQSILKRPLLYLSSFFKQHRDEYYTRLQAVRDDGEWEQWLRFFVTAVWQVSQEAADTARQILRMREEHRHMIQERVTGSVKGLELLDHLYQAPYLSVDGASTFLNVSYPTANSLISNLVQLGLLREVTGRQRGRLFEYSQYIKLLQKGTELTPSTPP